MSADVPGNAHGREADGGLPVFEVLEPGLLTSVQDRGRPDAARWGVPRGGAADPASLARANALLGNEPGAAALELTLGGPLLAALTDTRVALAGADLGAHVREGGARLDPGASIELRAGQVLDCRGPARAGARAYLAVPGGVRVPVVLGSRSTALGAGFGGLLGRALRTGDVIRAGRAGDAVDGATHGATGDVAAREVADGTRRPVGGTMPPPPGPGGGYDLPAGIATVRVTPGPHASGAGDPRLTALAGTSWYVDPASDRMGLRLQGPPLTVEPGAGNLASFGVLPGAVQLPPDGQPIVLLADAQPTGGYPVPAVVVGADLHLLAQLRPGETLRFAVVSRVEAVAALRSAALQDAR